MSEVVPPQESARWSRRRFLGVAAGSAAVVSSAALTSPREAAARPEVTAPRSAGAPGSATPKIGYILGPKWYLTPEDNNLPPKDTFAREFFEGLRSRGWRWTRPANNVEIVIKDANPPDYHNFYKAASELVTEGVNVIVLAVTKAIEPALDATMSTPKPLVVTNSYEPALLYLKSKYPSTGVYLTGLTINPTGLAVQRLDVLKEALPRVSRVVILFHPNMTTYGRPPYPPSMVQAFQDAGNLVGIECRPVTIHSPQTGGAPTDSEIKAAFQSADCQNWAHAVLVLGDPVLPKYYDTIASEAKDRQLPAMGTDRRFAAAGGLLSFGPNEAMLFWRAAAYVDKILKLDWPNTLPSEALPLEYPSRWELAINTDTAVAVGHTFPREIYKHAPIRFPGGAVYSSTGITTMVEEDAAIPVP
jgi:putative ABC transport system substrate-binding protein